MNFLCFMSILAHVLVPSLKVSMALALDSITHSQSISDGTTLVSQSGTFELGFFSPKNSSKHYLGIWYKNMPTHTVVWVANRLNPINNSFGTLTLNSTGNLVLSQNDTVVWYTTIMPHKQTQNLTAKAKLLDSANLVVWDENEATPEAYLWQSFDYPSDTLLPGMKLGWGLTKGLNWTLTAWKSPNDPAPGDFSNVVDQSSYPSSYLMKGEQKYSRFIPGNSMTQISIPSIYGWNFVQNKDEVYYTYYQKNQSVLSRLVLNQTDYTRSRYVWMEAEQNWRVYASMPLDNCDQYGLCGANGICVITETPVCGCLKGFQPKSPQWWSSMDWSQGCVRNKPLSCMEKQVDEFMKMGGVKVPDTTHSWMDEAIGLEECRAKCLNNCSCTAYANSNITEGGRGCVMWFGDLIDIRQFDGMQELYVRMDASELEHETHGHRKKLVIVIATIIAGISGMLLVGCYFIYKVCRNRTDLVETLPHCLANKFMLRNFMKYNTIVIGRIQTIVYILLDQVARIDAFFESDEKSTNIQDKEEHDDDVDLPLLKLSTVASATSNFSINNKMGQGGFGPVYKGRLENGKEIAVKRLSESSGQGMTEFKNEVKLIARLQHRNLVKLLGCCIERQEQMLIYEYMPNGSLDSFIFDHTGEKLLDWSRRFHIIYGIARGLLYLHQDSRLRIIHRDLKASNVLLDDKLNPKISDFGIAKTFEGDQTEGNTSRVVGTYGYMAPEYIAEGLFSIKSDVFSFGVMMLEIIHGRRNNLIDHGHNLIGHAWMLWKEGRGLELIDKNIEDSRILSQVLRCIHVSLLCTQQDPDYRPNMSSVILMLGSETDIPGPKQPAFFFQAMLHCKLTSLEMKGNLFQLMKYP